MNNSIKNIMYIFNDGLLGGAGYSLLDTVKEIRKYINPTIVMPKAAEARIVFETLDIHCYELDFAVDYVKMGEVTAEKQEVDYKQSYEAALQLLPIIVKENVQLIHINSSVSYFAAIAALMAGIPYIYHIRELMEEQFGCEFINRQLKQQLYLQADKLIAISDYVQKIYKEKYFVETERIYDGIDIQKYKLDLDNDKKFENQFLAVAVISQGKGQIDAIHAMEILIDKGYVDIQLVIVGADDSTYVWALKKYIKSKRLEKNIKILPFQSDLKKLHRQASYALTCSQNEALGRVTIEAMLGGNVIIGADSGGTTEIIGRDENRGFLYELHNSEALADAMLKAMQCSNKTKRKMLEDAQKYAENVFSISKYCAKILNIYKEVLSSFHGEDNTIFLKRLKEKYESVKNKDSYKKKDLDNRNLKAEAAFSMAAKWLEIRQNGHKLLEYFEKHCYKSVAIYGMARLGCRLYDELENTGIEIKYLLDRAPGDSAKVLRFTSLGSEKLKVDVIVVTVASAEREIVKKIKTYGYSNVIGLSDILNELVLME